MADCPHTIGVEFGTRLVEVNGQKIKLQIWFSLNLFNLYESFILGTLQGKNVSELLLVLIIVALLEL